MASNKAISERFEEQRPRLRGIAHRLLGNRSDADDVVQDAWLRLARTDPESIENLDGWLTTVVSRLAIDRLRAGGRVDLGGETVDGTMTGTESADPATDAVAADSVSEALLIVLDTLRPAERLAFVLHDTFAVPFDQIGAVLGRSPAVAKQLASRARAKVHGVDTTPDQSPSRRRAVIDAFLDASRNGNFEALVELLHPDIALLADDAAVAMGSPGRVAGATGVAGMFSGRALAAQCVQIDGMAGIAWFVNGTPRVVWELVVEDGVITHIDMIAAADAIAALDIEVVS
jgi:RNA polymerase sigma-70 factor (ECF subfamily)